MKKFGIARAINNSVLQLTRRAFMDRLGSSFFGRTGRPARNIYDTLGYLKELTFEDFYARYTRGDIAKRVVDAPVDACWRLNPQIVEKDKRDPKEETTFEKEVKDIFEILTIPHYLSRADKLSGIGRYGILMIGFNDSAQANPEREVVLKSGLGIEYLMPYHEGSVTVSTWETNKRSPRFGLPLVYNIKTSNNRAGIGASMNVHYSRVLHVAEGLIENNVYGTPRMEPVYNRLQDLELVAGGSGEMFWRGASPGYNFKLDSDVDPKSIDTDDIKNQIKDYIHDLERYMTLQGVEAQALESQVASPKEHVDVQLKLISATTRIPRRILEGSERGELASSQDETNWISVVDERRSQYVSPMILTPFINKLINYRIVTRPEKGFKVVWPSLFTPSDTKKAEAAVKYSQALYTYVNSLGADRIVPPEIFLSKFMGFDDGEIREVNKTLEISDSEGIPSLQDIGQEGIQDRVTGQTQISREPGGPSN